MPAVARILDANANRAREALRVMEEAARFLLDDEGLTRRIKSLRHDLRDTLRLLPGDPIASRDTPGDVGTGVKTEAEAQRDTAADVAVAAGKRLSEALRALEEYGKTAPAPGFPAAIEGLRYRGYDIERQLNLALGSGRRRQWRLCVLLSETLCPRADWYRVARGCVEGGADCLQLREKDLEAGELLRRARELVALCAGTSTSLIVNDRPDVALAAGADGVHLGQGDLPCTDARRLVGRQLLIGVSTSRIEEAEQALRDGADYCGVGPMFPTTTKHKDVIVGPDYLRRYLAWDRLPHLAIGGITPDNVGLLAAAGAGGVAVSSCVCRAEDPASTCRAILGALADRPSLGNHQPQPR